MNLTRVAPVWAHEGSSLVEASVEVGIIQQAKQAASALAFAFGKDVTAIMDYTKLAGDTPKERLEITGVVTVEYRRVMRAPV